MTSADLRRLVVAMTERPWEANGRDVRCAKGLFAELLDVNHIGDSEQNAAAIAALANHADALVALLDACEGVAKLGSLLHTTVGTPASEFSVWERMISALAAVHAIKEAP